MLGISLFFTGLVYLISCLRVINEWERGVVLTFGKFSGVKQPGWRLIFWPFQSMIKVDMRTLTIDVNEQEVITKDNVTVKINSITYIRIVDPAKSVIKAQNPYVLASTYSQTILRDIVGTYELDELLQKRAQIASQLKDEIDRKMDEYGVDVVDVKIQDIIVDDKLKNAMARVAEAEREKRAIITKAAGEEEAAKKYLNATKILGKDENALYLRTLHLLSDISKDPSNKFIVVPLEFAKLLKKGK
ncbi:MAG: slipin family protein [Candidatus Nanohaloarchaeota archaeon]|nr:slipin family protein [Candidatus Nanohaloarchaeota archaeon]